MSIETVKDEFEDKLLSLPNVTGVGIGDKAGKEVIKVFVTHKVPREELQPDQVVPERLGEYETEVEEIGTIEAQPRRTADEGNADH